jgi:putative lipoprotein
MRSLMTVAAVIGLAGCSGHKNVPAAAKPEGATMATVTGTVFYLERIALPPGAVVTVQLADVSRADAPGDIIAKAVIRPTTQVPIPFSLSYDTAHIVATHTYVVQARIEVEGKLRYISTTSNPVITNGKPSHADIRVSSTRQ